MNAAAAGAERAGVDVHCRGVVHLYRMPEGDVVALRGVDLDVDAGEAVALLGPSASGKSTVLGLLAGLLRPSAGEVRVGPHDLGRMSAGELLRLRGAEIGVVLQDPARNLLPYATALQNVGFARRGRRRARGWQATELMERLRLTHLAGRTVASLSGGEQQQVAVAVALAAAPRLLLVDEPTSQMDTAGRDAVIDLLGFVNRELRTTVVMVTHDPAVAAATRRTVTIRDGRVGSEGRRGEEYAVVGRDGSVQLPPDVLEVLRPGALVRIRRHADGVELRRTEGPG